MRDYAILVVSPWLMSIQLKNTASVSCVALQPYLTDGEGFYKPGCSFLYIPRYILQSPSSASLPKDAEGDYTMKFKCE